MITPLDAPLATAGRLLFESGWSVTAVALVALAIEPLLRRTPAALRSALLAVAVLRFLWPASLGTPWGFDGGAAAIAAAATGPRPGPVTTWVTAALLAAWGFGLLVAVARLAAAHAWCAGWRHGRTPDPDLARRLDALAAQLGLRRAPAVVVRDDATVPFVVGAGHPVLVLPETPVATAALLHELAHVKRGDLWLRGLAACATAIWWWHPLVHVLAARLHAAQEEACDDLAIAASGVTPDHYGALLVAAARDARAMPAAPVAAAAARFDGRSLERRVRRLLDPARPSHRLGPAHLLLIVAAVAFALPRAAAPGLGFRLVPGASQPHVHLHSHRH